MNAVATSNGADQIGNAVALVDGFSAAFVSAAAVALIGAAVAARFLRRPPAAVEPDDERRPAIAA